MFNSFFQLEPKIHKHQPTCLQWLCSWSICFFLVSQNKLHLMKTRSPFCFVVVIVTMHQANKCKFFIFRGKLGSKDFSFWHTLFLQTRHANLLLRWHKCKNIVNTRIKGPFLFLKIVEPICRTIVVERRYY